MSAVSRRRGASGRTATSRPVPLKRRGSYQADKDDLVRRFNRLIGQLEGVREMVVAERYCPEVLLQLSSAIAALEKIGFILLRDHIRSCVVEGVRTGQGDDYMDELMATIQRFLGR